MAICWGRLLTKNLRRQQVFLFTILLCLLHASADSNVFSAIPVLTEHEQLNDGVVVLNAGVRGLVNVVGKNLVDGQGVIFTWASGEIGDPCTVALGGKKFSLNSVSKLVDGGEIYSAQLSYELPDAGQPLYYICLEQVEADQGNVSLTTTISTVVEDTANLTINSPSDFSPTAVLLHQGTTVKFRSKSPLLPLWLQIILIILFLALSGMFSGLNLGLMSLDPTELIIVQNSGSETEKKFASKIQPVRKHGNFLLCTLLLGNVIVNSSLTILLDEIGGGLIAVMASTVGIVIFGEIVPQAICSRHGLAVGARTIWLTKLFMVITFPVSFPLSKLLDCILGEELGQVYNREKLAELIRLGTDKQDIKHEELNIIQGALQLTKKVAQNVMTPIDDVYMVDYDAILDFETMSDIMHTGYSRVPVFEKDRLNIVALLNIKDLAFVDPDDSTPLKTVCKFYNHPITFVFEDTKLDQLLEEFKKGQSHMAFVQRVVNDEQSDPSYQVLGIVTLEDIIEEIIQCEILDETDIVTDNRTKRRRHNMRKKDFSAFNEPDDQGGHAMSPQLTLATFQFLSSNVEAFKEEYVSGVILKKLLKKDIYVEYVYDEKSIDTLLYIAGKPADYFIVILQGRCSVEIGREKLKFEAGPFYTFGIEALTYGGGKDLHSNSASNLSDIIYSKRDVYIPDFTVRALTSLEYLKIRSHHYLAARRATIMERQPKSLDANGRAAVGPDIFTTEWKLALQQSQQAHASEEGIRPLHQYHRLHQRNLSSGNLEELKSNNLRLSLKPSPLVGNTNLVESGPIRTIIYPERQVSNEDGEKSKLLAGQKSPDHDA